MIGRTRRLLGSTAIDKGTLSPESRSATIQVLIEEAGEIDGIDPDWGTLRVKISRKRDYELIQIRVTLR